MRELTYQVIGCAIEVHKPLGPGLLESVYEKFFLSELDLRKIANTSQIWVPLEYKGMLLNTELRLDVLVEDLLCVELKAQEGLLPIHYAILLSYANAGEAKRHSYKFSLCEYFQRGTKNSCEQPFFFIARRIIKLLCDSLCIYVPMWLIYFNFIFLIVRYPFPVYYLFPFL